VSWVETLTDYDRALDGVKTVLCTLPHIEGWAEVFPSFLKACKAKKVEHFVKLSFLRPTHAFKGVAEVARMYRENVPFVSFHGTCDDILEQAKKDSRISFTILCTSHLMAMPLLAQGKTLREEHKFITASYGMGVNYVSPNDVADAAVVVLLDQKPHRNKVYNLTGPGPTKDSEVAALLSEHYGTKIEHIQLGYHDYAKDVKKRGLQEWQVRDAASMERMKAHGLDEHKSSYTDDVLTITGHKPETFADYLHNKACMRPGLTFP
jgi:NAD(P)H dehydrogenase (quinone)